MGCTSSAQTQTQDSQRPAAKPGGGGGGGNGLPKCDENAPVTEENETIPDQTKLDLMEEVDITPEETQPSENLPADKPKVLIPAPEEHVNSDYKREDLDIIGSMAVEPLESTGSLAEHTGTPPPIGSVEHTEIPPCAGPAEGIVIPLPAGPVEESVHPVTEVIRKIKINKEDQQIEGETGEKVEAEKHSELLSEGIETKEETREAVDATSAPERETTNNEE
ncbi:glutamate-rich protein 5 [Carettochelys insculpta]|uniref:glutamate-rich protein 5 n=1 Tax=Carettochelys insculpta TaxID=44489 RepID=UPI003EB7EF35